MSNEEQWELSAGLAPKRKEETEQARTDIMRSVRNLTGQQDPPHSGGE